ncbi:hypothetical protein Tco_1175401 [Tanacetum coccineum]
MDLQRRMAQTNCGVIYGIKYVVVLGVVLHGVATFIWWTVISSSRKAGLLRLEVLGFGVDLGRGQVRDWTLWGMRSVLAETRDGVVVTRGENTRCLGEFAMYNHLVDWNVTGSKVGVKGDGGGVGVLKGVGGWVVVVGGLIVDRVLKKQGYIGEEPLKYWKKNGELCKMDIINPDITIEDKPLKDITFHFDFAIR